MMIDTNLMHVNIDVILNKVVKSLEEQLRKMPSLYATAEEMYNVDTVLRVLELTREYAHKKGV